MVAVPSSANSVYIPMIQTGCMKAEFDSTYPVHLNGIISQYEFQQSIERINASLSAYKNLIISCIVVFIATMVIGTLCFLIGGVMAMKSFTVFYVLLGFGIVLTTFGSLFFSLGLCIVASKRTARMRQTVVEESTKYMSRSTPCSWRLDVSRTWGWGYNYNNNRQVFYQLVIDIGNFRPMGDTHPHFYSNRVSPEPRTMFGRQEDAFPPPYSAATTEACFQCGTARESTTARFCSSCGHPFKS